MVSLSQPCIGTGETLVLAQKYGVHKVVYKLITFSISVSVSIFSK